MDALLVKCLWLAPGVVAVAGSRVSCCTAHRLELNGRPLREDYLPPGESASTLGFDRQVPAGQLFVAGDNRAASLDSRSLAGVTHHGLVPVSAVVGRVVMPLGLKGVLGLHP